MTTTAAARQETGIVADGADTATDLRRAWKNYRAYRATLAELAALSDRELSDIGMRRDMLGQIARRAVYGN